ncbi:MAG: DEAD/DEAH box helicase [Acidimicrobiaceae bacterium]|nr:DEAD/DEAH box helicase [Acidimicrobiaceae bacterium]
MLQVVCGAVADPGGAMLLDLLNRRFASPQQRGRVFERLLKAAFEAHPGAYGPQRFRRVWRWPEWPDRERLGYGADFGIDLVAELTDEWGGGLCAVQAKCYDPSATIAKSDVDSFLSASAAERFTSRLLVVTAELGANADLVVRKAHPRCEVLHAADLDGWPVDWAAFLDRPQDLRFASARYEPKPYQSRAVDAVVDGLAGRDRGKLILPCGTGKSVVSLWIAERMAGAGGRVLYLVPSIALMGQTMREWAAQRDPRIPHRYIGVCSDTRAGRNDEDADLVELAMPVTTEPDRVAAALAEAAGEAMTVVFCTYQSLEVVEQAQRSVDGGAVPARFDLALCDEAHRTTGVHEADAGSHFTLVHDGSRIASAKRLYMTATPRVYTDRVRAQAREHSRDFDVFSMDDEATYGPELYRMSFGAAVEHGHLSDYEVLVIAVSELHIASLLGDGVLNLADGASAAGGGGGGPPPRR